MARGSFSRTVARAAASGGSRTYRARPPTAWYLLLFVICAAGVALIVYSRNERLHPASAVRHQLGPSASDTWHVAFAVDVCGRLQPNLPVNPNLASTGLRTYGDGLIDVAPGAAPNPAAFEGALATLGNFADHYPGFTLTATSLKLPGAKTTYRNGTSCPASATTPRGPGVLQAKVWPSTDLSGARVETDPASIHLGNGMMITLAFVPRGAPIPPPPSRATLAQALGATLAPSTSTPRR
ncbi:MAG TPA: hypothetical protein VKV23_03215 [Acidimicrobiales bacterium]|nr:hypothetical protein [Acidimicrobiales bacterium]